MMITEQLSNTKVKGVETTKELVCCPICNNSDVSIWSKSEDLEYYAVEEEFVYYHCPTCVTIFINPMPVSKLAEIYPSNYYSFLETKKSLAHKVKEYLDDRLFGGLLNKIEGSSLKVLDVGGGSGWLLDNIKKLDKRVQFTQVVDIDKEAQHIAEKNGHHYFHGTIEDFESDEKFDLVLMLNLIEHISDPKQTLDKIEGMLNPGGIVLIKTPNIESWDARLFKNSYWGGLHCPRHWILFSQKSFRHLLNDSNLSINYLKYTQGAPFWSWSLLIKLKQMGYARIDKNRPVVFHPLIPLLSIFFAGFDFLRGLFGAKTSQMFIELKKTESS